MRAHALAMVLVFVGCAYRTPTVHLPSSLPRTRVELAGVDVTQRGKAVDAKTAGQVGRWTGEILAKAAARRGVSTAPGGVRVQVQVDLVDQDRFAQRALAQDGFAVFGMIGIPFGQDYEGEKVSVQVTAEWDGRTVTGHGTAEKWGSIYAPARRRALAVALDQALADAFR